VSADFTVAVTSWTMDAPALQLVRRTVFIDEQRVPENLEWDELDPQCVHALARDRAGAPIGCARLLEDGHIGRVAVLAPWRGRGVGDALMTCLIAEARTRGHARVMLNAQTQAMPFYARHGFAAEGRPFEEAGIPHQAMALTLR
jgi:predicted GNAT family N-acyltransferase